MTTANKQRLVNKTAGIIFLIILLSAATASAQIDILRKAVAKINGHGNISYNLLSRQKSPFGDDTTTFKIKYHISKTLVDGRNVELFKSEDARGFTEIYNGSIDFSLDLNNKTFRIHDDRKSAHPSPFYWASFIETHLEKSPEKISVLSDTVIDRTKCYHIRFSLTVQAPDLEIYDLYLNRDTFMPVYTRAFMQGTFGKGGQTIDGIASMVTSNAYSNYLISPNNFPDLSSLTVPADFNPEKKLNLLSVGKKAPDWSLTDARGNLYSNDSLKGKVTLIEFSFNSCAACALAIPVIKRLEEKYKEKNVQIISINTLDSQESVLRFATKQKIEHPILINAKATGKAFQVSSYPTFYLIDQQGNIVSAIDGYSDKLENTLVGQIDRIL